MCDTLLYELDGNVLYLTLNRPQAMNALNHVLKAELADAIARAATDPGVRAVVLTGAGRGFCAGGDIKEMDPDAGPVHTVRKLDRILRTVLVPLATLRKPTIAAVNGFAVGAGFNLALACDMIVAADTAVFSQVFVRVGLVPDSGGLYFLTRVLGLNRAKELCFTGRDVTAAEAGALGFVNRVVPAAGLMAAARELAAAVASGPAVAIALTKAALNMSATASLSDMMEMETLAQAVAASTPEHAEGLAAFGSRRKPDFTATPDCEGPMDFDYTPEQEAFRTEVRTWIKSVLPTGWGETVHEPQNEAERARFKSDWDRTMYDGGWAGIAWSKDYGGRGATLVEQAIFLEEMARARAPEGLNIVGRNLAGPTLIRHGTEAQRQRFLKPILSGEEVWCQGFSEPNSGSDLASLRCRAELRGDRFIVNGQKVWTSFAQYAQWCFLLCRTDPAAAKHKGISFLLVDMKSPGITIRPLVQINGDTEFSEVFFDDVEVPAENLVGALNAGWSIAMTTLTFERGPEEALYRQVKFKYDLDRLVEFARSTRRGGRPIAQDPIARQKIAATAMEVELLRLNILRAFSKVLNGKELGPEASFTKLYWSHMWVRMAELAMELQGPSAPLAAGDPSGLGSGTAQFNWLSSKASTIYSGTSEVQRNIIGERVLGLPKEPVAA